MSEHAVLPPSSAARWVACAGSVTLGLQFPETEEQQDALEGIATHWAASEMLQGKEVCLGQVAPNGVTLDDEMIEAAEVYVGSVLADCKGNGLHVEEKIECPTIHLENWGTPDCWFYNREQGILYIWDFKYGHRFIEVFENWQLLNYASGILDHLGIDGQQDQHLHVVMRIVQPRSYHRDGPIRTWACMASDLRPYFNILRAAAEAAFKPDPVCTVNTECDFCPGRHACEALARASVKAVDMSSSSVPVELPPTALGLELRTLERAQEMLEARISGLRAVALSTIKRGTLVPFFTVAETVGRQKWSKPIPEVIALGEMLGLKLAKPDCITPKQAIKLGIDEAVIKMYSEIPRGALALVPDNTTNARKVFSK